MAVMNYKSMARKAAEIKKEKIKTMRYFAWDGDKFAEKRQLPDYNIVGIEKFVEERNRRDMEIDFMDELIPFIAYIMSPTSLDAEDVIEQMFESISKEVKDMKRSKGVEVDLYGFTQDFDVAAKIERYNQFTYVFKKQAEAIEKSLSKNKLFKDIILN